MANSPANTEPTPKLGAKATVVGLIFALLVLGGFGAAVAAQSDGDAGYGADHSEDADKDHSDEDGSHDDEEDHE